MKTTLREKGRKERRSLRLASLYLEGIEPCAVRSDLARPAHEGLQLRDSAGLRPDFSPHGVYSACDSISVAPHKKVLTVGAPHEHASQGRAGARHGRR